MKLTLDVGQIFTAVIALISFVAGMIVSIRTIVRPLREMAADWREFRGDWYGVPARPGFPGHPGMGERVAQTEQDIGAIKSELQTNGGRSLRDAINQIYLQLRITSQHSGAPVVAQPDPNHEQQHQTIGASP